MKNLKRFATLVAVVMAMVAASAPTATAGGPFRFGIRAGVNVNELKFDKNEVFDSKNQTGFTGGVTAQFVVPIIGIGIDASVMYTRRNAVYNYTNPLDNLTSEQFVNHRDYIEIPINARWNINLPVVSAFLTPYIFTGPDFSFLTSPKTVKLPELAQAAALATNDASGNVIGTATSAVTSLTNKSYDVAWNFGLGVKLINKIEVAASYGLGITDSASGASALYGDSKNRFWTITATYLF